MEFLVRTKNLAKEIRELKEYCKIISENDDPLEGLYKVIYYGKEIHKYLKKWWTDLFLDIKHYIAIKKIMDVEEYKQLNKLRYTLKELDLTLINCLNELDKLERRFEGEYLSSIDYNTEDETITLKDRNYIITIEKGKVKKIIKEED